MRNGVDYTKKDEVILGTLLADLSENSLVLHADSGLEIDGVRSKLQSRGLYSADVSDVLNLNYKMFASKSESAAGKVAELSARSWDEMSRSKQLLVQMYESFMPKCCVERLYKDLETSANTTRRYALQLLDFSRQNTISISDLQEQLVHKPKEEKEKDSEGELHKRRSDSDQEIGGIINEGKEGIFLGNLDGIAKVVYNFRLSGELPMCKPGCEKIFDNYTKNRLFVMNELNYNVGILSYDVGSFVESTFASHYWNSGKGSIEEVPKMFNGLDLKVISKISDLERSRVGDDIVDLKKLDEKTIAVPVKTKVKEVP